MAGIRRDPLVRKKVEKLRKAGKTYPEIQKFFPIPKSTLSVWLNKKYPVDRSIQLAHLKRIRPLANAARRNERIARDLIFIAKGKKEAKKFPVADKLVLKGLLAMLYWAEGAKHEKVHGLKFVNTDPRLAKLYITLVRHCFPIDESRFRIRLHLHSYHKPNKTVKFWSELLRVPKSQFGKIYIKKRMPQKNGRKIRENFMGICFINYLNDSVRKEVLTLGYGICDKVCRQ